MNHKIEHTYFKPSDGNGLLTLAFGTTPSGTILITGSNCSEKDQMSRYIGRTIALNRLEKAAYKSPRVVSVVINLSSRMVLNLHRIMEGLGYGQYFKRFNTQYNIDKLNKFCAHMKKNYEVTL